jgi:hypothetical protein
MRHSMQRHKAVIMAVRAATALAIVVVSTAAIAQRIPSSEMPGRERERFTDPPQPLSQSGGSVFSTVPTWPPAVKRHRRNPHARGYPKSR